VLDKRSRGSPGDEDDDDGDDDDDERLEVTDDDNDDYGLVECWRRCRWIEGSITTQYNRRIV